MRIKQKINENIFTIFILFSHFIGFPGCIQKTSSTSSFTPKKDTKEPKSDTAYYIAKDGDDVFEEIVTEKYPIPFVGKDEFFQKLARSFKYPASARENGISGFVVLDVLVEASKSVK